MHTLCAGLLWTTIRARLSLLDKNIGTSTRFYITYINHIPKILCIFLAGCYYAPYATCMAMPLVLANTSLIMLDTGSLLNTLYKKSSVYNSYSPTEPPTIPHVHVKNNVSAQCSSYPARHEITEQQVPQHVVGWQVDWARFNVPPNTL